MHAFLALSCRDDALTELATAYADMEAMQATLADSAVYVRCADSNKNWVPEKTIYRTSESQLRIE